MNGGAMRGEDYSLNKLKTRANYEKYFSKMSGDDDLKNAKEYIQNQYSLFMENFYNLNIHNIKSLNENDLKIDFYDF